MPVIDKGYTADLAIEESYRVLKPRGLIFVFVKGGEGLKQVDTHEGLGGRVFQFFNENLVKDLLIRIGFSIVWIARVGKE